MPDVLILFPVKAQDGKSYEMIQKLKDNCININPKSTGLFLPVQHWEVLDPDILES